MTFEILLFILVVAFVGLYLFSSGQTQTSAKPIKKGKKEGGSSLDDKVYRNYLSRFDSHNDMVKLSPVLTSVAGVRYKNDDTGVERQSIIKRTKEGERLMLIPDELNKYDRDAVKVVRLSGEQIGFLDTDLALEIKARLNQRLRVDAKIKRISDERGILEVWIELVKYSRKK